MSLDITGRKRYIPKISTYKKVTSAYHTRPFLAYTIYKILRNQVNSVLPIVELAIKKTLSGCDHEEILAMTYSDSLGESTNVVKCDDLLEEIKKRIASWSVREVGHGR